MMSTTRKRGRFGQGLALGIAAALAAPAQALDLTLPTGARETVGTVSDADVYNLPIGAWAPDTGVPNATLEGQVVRKAWRVSGPSITTGQVLTPLREQLTDAGYSVIFECADVTCGGFDFRFGTEVLAAPNMYVDLSDYRFLSAKGPDATTALGLLVSRDSGSVFVQMIEVGPPRRAPVTVTTSRSVTPQVDIDDLITALERDGHVVLSDLDFASGEATLGAGPRVSLDVIADYLITNPIRQITFVGHTDATGSLAANVALSKRRAEAARSYVIQKGVAAAQVTADGVGFLSPKASNLTAEGREANRRVEAVLISTE